jgi:hypothetical protein
LNPYQSVSNHPPTLPIPGSSQYSTLADFAPAMYQR